eukprot:gene14980-15119_t
MQPPHVLVAELVEPEQSVAGVLVGADELVELELDHPRVPVLRVLQQEHHQEGDDGGAGVDDELPGVGILEIGAADPPQDHDGAGRGEGVRLAELATDPLGEAGKQRFHGWSFHVDLNGERMRPRYVPR